jgi:glutamate/tyrosine decarboxylase-like PLP-dependent enzyme
MIGPMADRTLLARTAGLAAEYLHQLPERPVARPVDLAALRAAFGGPLPERGQPADQVIEQLAAAADPGLVASAGPRYFGFVIGGSHSSALAADWLTSAWDQNAAFYVMSPAAAVAEEVAAGWLLELWGLPPGSSVGFTTGATMANFTALAAGRHRVLERAGWNVEDDGLVGAPPIAVVLGEEAHATVLAALQMLGLGRARVLRAASDEQGRMRPDALASVLAGVEGPTIVCAQSGNVNTGAFDPLDRIAPLVRARPNAWLHVDAAFGLWAAAVPDMQPLLAGLADADSWTTDSHKWLNVPYDSGVVVVRDPAAHHAAMSMGAAYYVLSEGAERDGFATVPESSRRARGFAVYAALRELGREGLVDLVRRCSALAGRMAERLSAADGVEVLNEVVLNQVLVRFSDDDAATREVVAAVQRDGTCWLGGTTWHGKAAMRISVSNWQTTEADIDRSAEAILRCAAEVAAARVT